VDIFKNWFIIKVAMPQAAFAGLKHFILLKSGRAVAVMQYIYILQMGEFNHEIFY